MSSLELATIVGGWATAVGAFLALVGGLLAWTTIRANRHDSQEATANERFRDYMLLAFENPRYSKPDFDRLRQDPEQFERYEWYVGMMLWACDEVLNCTKMTEAWRNSVFDHVAVHKAYLCSEGFRRQYLRHHGLPLQEVIGRVCAGTPANDIAAAPLKVAS